MINSDKIVSELAKKYKVPVAVVDDIVRSQFLFLAQVMTEGEFRGMTIHHIGLFCVKPFRKKVLDMKREAKALSAEMNEEILKEFNDNE